MKKPKKRSSRTGTTAAAADLLKIAADIGKLADEAEPSESWRSRVRNALTVCADRNEGMIRAGQAMRDAGVDVDFANMTICMGAEHIAEDRREAKMNRDFRDAEKGQLTDDGLEWEARRVEAAVLREFGEDEMADALLADEDAFLAKYREPGRLAHFGPLPKRQGNTGS